MLDTSISDSGFYQCIAENPYGSETATARIQITLGSEYKEMKLISGGSICLLGRRDGRTSWLFIRGWDGVFFQWIKPNSKESMN